jgi:hypothetical protein
MGKQKEKKGLAVREAMLAAANKGQSIEIYSHMLHFIICAFQ